MKKIFFTNLKRDFGIGAIGGQGQVMSDFGNMTAARCAINDSGGRGGIFTSGALLARVVAGFTKS